MSQSFVLAFDSLRSEVELPSLFDSGFVWSIFEVFEEFLYLLDKASHIEECSWVVQQQYMSQVQLSQSLLSHPIPNIKNLIQLYFVYISQIKSLIKLTNYWRMGKFTCDRVIFWAFAILSFRQHVFWLFRYPSICSVLGIWRIEIGIYSFLVSSLLKLIY